jgi:hypothetical protein
MTKEILMKKSRYTDSQILVILKQAEALGMIDIDSVNNGYEYDRKDAERKLLQFTVLMKRDSRNHCW